MKRVLHYGMSPNLGGIETYLFDLTRNVDKTQFQFDFLYSDHGQKPVFASALEPAGSRFYGVTPRRKSPRRNQAELEKLFTDEHFDYLHFHANTASYVEPVRAALRSGVKVVYHSHNAGASRSRLTRFLHNWNRRTLPWDSIARVAVSSEAGQWMFGPHSFEVLHNGIDVDSFAFNQEARERKRAELGLAPGSFAVGSIAAFLPAKNHEFTLRVFSEISRQRPSAQLLLIGSGPLEEDVRQLAQQLEIEHQVQFLGRRPDVAALLSAMDAFLLPSLHEGFPLVTIEAQASGLPCLLSASITREVLVTPFARQLPLREPPRVWAETLLEIMSPERARGAELVGLSGLSLESTTGRLESLYSGASSPEPS